MKNFISIPKPCNENWDAMSPEEQGKHCAKCNIVVRDFSAMSNEEILDYLKQDKKTKCAKIRTEQVLDVFNMSKKVKKFLYALAICFLPFTALTSASLLIPTEANAQENPGGLDGKIFNDKGEPLPFAVIIVEQDGIQKKVTKSDINGNYKLKPLAKGYYTLKVERLGYTSLEIKEVEVKSGESLMKNITIKKDKNRRIHIVGIIIHKSIIDQEEPNKQEISGDQIRDMFGG